MVVEAAVPGAGVGEAAEIRERGDATFGWGEGAGFWLAFFPVEPDNRRDCAFVSVGRRSAARAAEDRDERDDVAGALTRTTTSCGWDGVGESCGLRMELRSKFRSGAAPTWERCARAVSTLRTTEDGGGAGTPAKETPGQDGSPSGTISP